MAKSCIVDVWQGHKYDKFALSDSFLGGTKSEEKTLKDSYVSILV